MGTVLHLRRWRVDGRSVLFFEQRCIAELRNLSPVLSFRRLVVVVHRLLKRLCNSRLTKAHK